MKYICVKTVFKSVFFFSILMLISIKKNSQVNYLKTVKRAVFMRVISGSISMMFMLVILCYAFGVILAYWSEI